MQTPDNNTELLRLYYLQQLGIASYVPRSPLPGALTQEFETEDAQSITAEAESVVMETPERTAITIEAEPVIGKPREKPQVVVEAPKPPQSPPRKAETAPVLSPETQKILPFQILFTVIDAELAIAIQIPHAMKPQLREADTKLLLNILRWLGVVWPVDRALLQFHWPLPGLADTGDDQAGKGLRAFLHQAALEQPFQRLVVFGNEPAQALRVSGDSLDWQVWYTHSLAELLALPSLKHETWQALIPLKAQLAS